MLTENHVNETFVLKSGIAVNCILNQEIHTSALLKVMYKCESCCKSNHFFNILYFSKTCITETVNQNVYN